MADPKTAEVRDLLKHLATYEATPPTLADGEAHPLTLTSDGKLRVDDPTTQAAIDDIEAKLDSATYGLAALKALVDAIPTTPELEVDASTRYTVLAAYVDTVESLLTNVTYGLSALKTMLDTAQADLDNPNQYKADVSALALEATLTAIKGASWTTETLKAIKDAVDTRLAAASYVTERGTDNAMLAASYVTERGTDSAMLAANGALEATLTAIKGAGWSTQTLVAIKAAIDAISGGATAQQVWEYATRILTNLSDVRAAKIDNLDAAISSRLAAASYTAERGTNSAALAAVCTEARLARLDAAVSTRMSTLAIQATVNASQANPVGGTYYTALNYTGTGVLGMSRVRLDNYTGRELTIRFTINGQVFGISSPDTASQSWHYLQNLIGGIITTIPPTLFIPFSTSLKVEYLVNATTAGYTLRCDVMYWKGV